ncbi:MAG: PKD domain-containing protein, partial [Bacteroidota bacterium]
GLMGGGGLPGYLYSDNGNSFQVGNTFGSLGPGMYWFYVQDQNLCVDSIQVNITEPAPLTLSVQSQQDVTCNGASDGAVMLMGAGGTAAYEYSLDGVNYQASGNFNGLAPGNYTAFVQDANNCISTVNFTISEPAPLTLNVSGTSDVTCFGGMDGSVSLSAGGGTAPYQYSLQGGTLQNSPIFQNLSAGTYTFVVQDANSCTMTLQVTVTEPLELLAVLTNQVHESCLGVADGEAEVQAGGGTLPYTYQLDNGSAGANPVFSNLNAGPHTITITDANGCTVNLPFNIAAGTQPTAAFLVDFDPCIQPVTAAFLDMSQGATSYSWNFGDNGTSTDQNPNHDYLQAGNYTATLVVTDANGCVDSLSQNVAISDFPIAAFTSVPEMPAIIELGDEVIFENQSQNAIRYEWAFGDQQGTTAPNPTHIYGDPGEYCITLAAWSPSGCSDTTEQCAITVIETNIFIPTAFTPNGDGLNDVFQIVSGGIFDEWELMIFDRWGKLIFTGTTPDAGWDGRFREKPVQEGAYVFRLIARTVTGTQVQRNGSVTVLR